MSTSFARKLANYVNLYPSSSNPDNPILDGCLTDSWVTVPLNRKVSRQYQEGALDFAVHYYAGSIHGAFFSSRVHVTSPSYNPVIRPWYIRAVAHLDTLMTFSTPYIDAGGAGLVITSASPLFYSRPVLTNSTFASPNSTMGLFGVLGVDLVMSRIFTLLSGSTGCAIQDDTHSVDTHRSVDTDPMCFLIDTSGLLVSHSNFLRMARQYMTTGTVTGNPGNVFIGQYEPPIGRALVNQSVIKPLVALSPDGLNQMSWFQVDDTLFNESQAIIHGDIPSSACYKGTPSYMLSKIK